MIPYNVYYGAKQWEYEIKFNADFSKIVDGLVRQYNEKNEVVKIEPLLDSNQFYELQDENPTISTFKTNDFDDFNYFHDFHDEMSVLFSEDEEDKHEIAVDDLSLQDKYAG